MKNVEKNNPRHKRPSRWDKQTRREQLESKEQDNLRTERMKKNRAYRQFGRMEQRGWGRPHQRPQRHFGWRSEEACWSDEITAQRSGFCQRANRPLHKREEVAVRPRRWSWRPRHADEYRQEGGEFHNRRIREHARQAQPGQNRSHWSMRPRHADEFRREGGEFRGRRIREYAHQEQPAQRHPRHILREKWMLEQKLFRITHRLQRLNLQLRG